MSLYVKVTGSGNGTGGGGGGGTPGGTNLSVQYNNSGAFGGNSGFTYDGTNVSITNFLNIASLSASQLVATDGSKNLVSQAKGNLTEATSSVLTITGGTGSVIGSGTSIQVLQSGASQSGYLSSADWNTFNNKQAALTFGNLTDVGTDGITVTGGTGAVIGSGTSISQHVADTTHNGYLSSTDWNTFNGKQAAGNYITALTGDGTASGPGSAALTLAIVNSNVGSFSPAAITVNGKGLVTAASNVTTGNLTDAGTDGITVTGGTGAVLGSGTSIAQHVADTTHNGYLSSTDWNTFNGKQAAGNYITALTGDITASGPGNAAATLATVNSNVGTFASATVNGKGLVTAAANLSGDATTSGSTLTLATVNSNTGSFGSNTGIPSFTVNGKGLVTAASNNAVVTAPTASTIAAWDANKNLSANNVIDGFRTQATANSTLTLVVGDAGIQYFTGSTSGQIVKLPTTGIVAGMQYLIVNLSTQSVAVQSSGGNAILTIAANNQGLFTALVATPTTAANWNFSYSTTNNSTALSGTVTSVQVAGANGLSFSGGPITGSGTITASLTAPTVQTLTSGSAATYTTPAGCLYIRLRMIGGGSGGAGSGTGTSGGAGGAGGDTSWKTTGDVNIITAGGGGATGSSGGSAGAGGTNTIAAGPSVIKNQSGTSGGGAFGSIAGMSEDGGSGGMGPFGGRGVSVAAGVANTGAGGGGGYFVGAGNCGPGGGSGGYVEAFIANPSSSYHYTIGAAGSAGSAGTSGVVGTAGGSGVIIVEEYYQ